MLSKSSNDFRDDGGGDDDDGDGEDEKDEDEQCTNGLNVLVKSFDSHKALFNVE